MYERSFTCKEHSDGVSFRVKVQPRSSRVGITGVEADCLKISLSAPPVEGEANAACIKFIAEFLGLPKSRVTLAAGQRNRMKTIMVAGLDAEEVMKKVESALIKLRN